jgi:hypothetical protein
LSEWKPALKKLLEIISPLLAILGALLLWVPEKMPVALPAWINLVVLCGGVFGVMIVVKSWITDSNVQISADPTPTVSLTHSTNSGIINTGTLHVNSRFEITPEIASAVASQLDRSKPVNVAHARTARSKTASDQISSLLEAAGFEIAGRIEVGHASFVQPEQPITIYPNGLTTENVTLGGRVQTVFLDLSIHPSQSYPDGDGTASPA